MFFSFIATGQDASSTFANVSADSSFDKFLVAPDDVLIIKDDDSCSASSGDHESSDSLNIVTCGEPDKVSYEGSVEMLRTTSSFDDVERDIAITLAKLVYATHHVIEECGYNDLYYLAAVTTYLASMPD